MDNNNISNFIQDLKEAIETGQLLNVNSHIDDLDLTNNVNNLSNQTFVYIVNWLKNQQKQNDYNNKVN